MPVCVLNGVPPLDSQQEFFLLSPAGFQPCGNKQNMDESKLRLPDGQCWLRTQQNLNAGAAPASPAQFDRVYAPGVWGEQGFGNVPPILATSPKKAAERKTVYVNSPLPWQQDHPASPFMQKPIIDASPNNGKFGGKRNTNNQRQPNPPQRQTTRRRGDDDIGNDLTPKQPFGPSGAQPGGHRQHVSRECAPTVALDLISPPKPNQPASEAQAPPNCQDLSKLCEFAVPFRVRNTFLDGPTERSPSLERFLEERKVKSCPASGQHSAVMSRQVSEVTPDLEEPFVLTTPSGSVTMTPRASCGHGGLFVNDSGLQKLGSATQPELGHFRTNCSSATGSTAAGHHGWDGSSSGSGSGVIPQSEPSASDAIPSSQQTLVGGDASSRTIGSQVLPSRGSALHAWGACKPCAFVFQEGCQNGIDCQFCHLCDPGERKRRKKQRRKMATESRLRHLNES